ncbi:TetR/AcrR family transcriptional regulator [Xanthobacter sp. AM11]|uniref:TetR/AcrR family transcriptional regulator n=1 Tax=Xanthobacter sp. AM11 TaxID=3380643 RepID=UPI0039BEDD5D
MSCDAGIAGRLADGRDAGHGAGQDPEKRSQILAGAREVFFERGFDAASMGDIARAAGVSKGTLYVYFENKEDLFSALVDSECSETAERMFVLDLAGEDVEAVLTKLGFSFIQAVLRPSNIALLRTVIAISSKFPNIGRRFFQAGPCEGIKRLSVYLAAKVQQGVLEIEDVEQAASQFLTLCKDGVTTPVLIGSSDALDPAAVERSVKGAVRVFMRAYGARTDRQPQRNAARLAATLWALTCRGRPAR